MKKIWKLGSAVAVAFSVSFAWAQAPGTAPKTKGDPKVAECRAHNFKEHREISAMHAKAKAAKKISPAEEKEFGMRETRLKQHVTMLNKGGLTLDECHQITKELDREKAAVARMAKN